MSNDVKLSIKIRKHTFDFTDEEKDDLSKIGHIYSCLSRFEVNCDDVIFAMAKHKPEICHSISPSVPDSFDKKIDFIISVFKNIPELSGLRDRDGPIDIDQFREILKYVWTFRIDLTHGYMHLISKDGDDYYYEFSRYKKVDKLNYEYITYKYTKNEIEEIVELASYARSFLVHARSIIDGSDRNDG